jgi:hypothetical protein
MAGIVVANDVSCGGWGLPPARAGVQEQPQRRLHLAELLRGIAFPRQSPAFLRARGSMTKAQLSMVPPLRFGISSLKPPRSAIRLGTISSAIGSQPLNSRLRVSLWKRHRVWLVARVFNQRDGIHQQLILGLRNGQQWPAMEWWKSSQR